MKYEKVKINQLVPDPKNANKGTDKGNRALEQSLKNYGTGRSILIDKNGVVIAGNKTLGKAEELGIENVVIVPSDGKDIIAVQRTDLDINDMQARELAYADNRVSQLDLEWDVETVLDDMKSGVDIGKFFDKEEIEEMMEEKKEDGVGGLKKLSNFPPPKLAWVLMGIPVVDYGLVDPLIKKISEIQGIFIETTVSDE